ncbi:hypothetical protein [Rhodothermus profundi]|uniref:Uncharacterized HhH-GPD family protein n=1 Tax=Rhodothermus profundi TaxID=633813 RepID=A0A1M6X8P6_9BACT|nr:hypothetical protein [Rhodothermus profundi]SHL02155.1 uncharacterized HhH-GPD family protein [Rhodothermus profundi]
MNLSPIPPLDPGDLEGGFVRMMHRFHLAGTLTGDPEADAYLRQDANAVLLGLLYDQRVRAEFAFTGPIRLRNRLGHLDLSRIAAMPLETLQRLFAEKPAVHRFTNRMAALTQAVAHSLCRHYNGQAAQLWADGAPLPEVQARVARLPGFGADKLRKLPYVLHYFGHRDFSQTLGVLNG